MMLAVFLQKLENLIIKLFFHKKHLDMELQIGNYIIIKDLLHLLI